MLGRIGASLGIGVVALLAPSSAFATDYFVNGTTGNDANNCESPTFVSGITGPCDTIGRGIQVAQDGDASNVLIADGTYNENLTPNAGMTLSSSDGDVDPKPEIVGEVTIASTGASLDHLRLRSGVTDVVEVGGPATIADNEIVGNDVAFSHGVRVTGGAGDVTIARNSFTDNGTGVQDAVFKLGSSMSVSVLDNTISGFWRGVFASDVNGMTIRGNVITGLHDDSGFATEGLAVYGGLGYEIARNRIETGAATSGVGLFVGFVNQAASAALSRNSVLGPFGQGILIQDTSSLTSDSDVVSGAGLSLEASDSSGMPASTAGDVTVTNATFWAASGDNLRADGVKITLNSSIAGDGTADNGGNCAISFSRGDTAPGAGTPDPTDCDDFQTAADPLFVNEAANDFHLLPGSPMIDAGDPAPTAGLLDIDGEPRVMGGGGGCAPVPPRRDIGADEVLQAPAPASACLPPPVVTPQPPARKCKKGKKLKKVKGKKKCVRKKRTRR